MRLDALSKIKATVTNTSLDSSVLVGGSCIGQMPLSYHAGTVAVLLHDGGHIVRAAVLPIGNRRRVLEFRRTDLNVSNGLVCVRVASKRRTGRIPAGDG